MLKDKIKNAKTTNWLAEGLSDSEINSIKELAKISAKIEMKRNELGMNQKEFARMMNVSQGMVSKWESGEYNFTIVTLKEICDNLGLGFEPYIYEKKHFVNDEYKVIHTSFGRKSDLSKELEAVALLNTEVIA
ncbi:MAG: helix-turn-helix transcriptional regulator [Thermoflexaceae bacterium]|nr:helix-turn-helix transcriptional regulator [Thermoflexaceae bacterium]